MREHQTSSSNLLVYHVDLYRLDRVGAQDAAALGLSDAFANGISLVEWPERLDAASVPAERLEVRIEYNGDDDSNGGDRADASLRRVSFLPIGDRWTRSFVVGGEGGEGEVKE